MFDKFIMMLSMMHLDLYDETQIYDLPTVTYWKRT